MTEGLTESALLKDRSVSLKDVLSFKMKKLDQLAKYSYGGKPRNRKFFSYFVPPNDYSDEDNEGKGGDSSGKNKKRSDLGDKKRDNLKELRE